jgi:CRP/FNR family transcriptional regulator
LSADQRSVAADEGDLSERRFDFLALLPADRREELLARATRIVLPAGSLFYRPGDAARVDVIERGLIRAFYTDLEGRQSTANFVHPGEVAGLTTVVGESPPRLFAQAVVPTTLTALDPHLMKRLAAEDLGVMTAVARYLSWLVTKAFRLVMVRTLGTMRERVATDLMERALQHPANECRLQATATHSELAYSVGTSREVITRTLRSLRAEGLIATTPGKIEVLDPARLAAIVAGFSG